jgi:hypothetical protein|tara:strand:+ start:175 stop:480 length:306 start_codon:yes stop_codon:yes gene_type:complete
MRPALIAILCLSTACTQFPQLDVALDQAALEAPYPSVLALASLLEQVDQSGGTAQTGLAAVARFDGRLARLRAQASALRGPVVDRATRNRMARGIDIAALQ